MGKTFYDDIDRFSTILPPSPIATPKTHSTDFHEEQRSPTQYVLSNAWCWYIEGIFDIGINNSNNKADLIGKFHRGNILLGNLFLKIKTKLSDSLKWEEKKLFIRFF